MLTKLLKMIYNSEYVTIVMLQYIFIDLHKILVPIECNEFRTMNLINEAAKRLLRITMRRTRSKVKVEISGEKYEFVEGKGTNNIIYILQTLTENK